MTPSFQRIRHSLNCHERARFRLTTQNQGLSSPILSPGHLRKNNARSRPISNKAAEAEMQAWIAEAAERERLKEKT
jgi:hypothetical protein